MNILSNIDLFYGIAIPALSLAIIALFSIPAYIAHKKEKVKQDHLAPNATKLIKAEIAKLYWLSEETNDAQEITEITQKIIYLESIVKSMDKLRMVDDKSFKTKWAGLYTLLPFVGAAFWLGVVELAIWVIR